MLSDDTAFLLVTGALRKGARARTPRDGAKASAWAANRQSSASAERQATAFMVLRFLTALNNVRKKSTSSLFAHWVCLQRCGNCREDFT